jgi:hypothetical protein
MDASYGAALPAEALLRNAFIRAGIRSTERQGRKQPERYTPFF